MFSGALAPRVLAIVESNDCHFFPFQHKTNLNMIPSLATPSREALIIQSLGNTSIGFSLLSPFGHHRDKLNGIKLSRRLLAG
jgi:hypothetical protein